MTDSLATIGRRDLPSDPATLGGFAALPHVVISRRGRRSNRIEPGLRSYALPVPTDGIPAVMAWHARYEQDRAHCWLRAMISDVFTSIIRPGAA